MKLQLRMANIMATGSADSLHMLFSSLVLTKTCDGTEGTGWKFCGLIW